MVRKISGVVLVLAALFILSYFLNYGDWVKAKEKGYEQERLDQIELINKGR